MLDAIAAVTREAGEHALRRSREGFRRWDKAPGHPVSEVDLEVDRLLRERLGGLDPDAGWLSEETVDDPARLARKRVWVVDPIDGTRDFIRGRSGWCVSVALVEDGSATVGVLHAPARDELWTAERGRGARLNGAPVRASDRTELAGARFPIDELPRGERLFRAVAKPNSIALRMAMVAAGEADLLATARWGSEWDLAAAGLLVEEAGGVATDALGRALRFNGPGARVFGVLAAAAGIHAAAVANHGERARAGAGAA